MGGGTHGKGPGTPAPSLRDAVSASRGEDVRGAVDALCRDAVRLLQEGQAARAYAGLVSASRSLPMTPRLAAVLVRCALKAGTERAVITLLDAAMVSERGDVRREVRRQLSRVLRRTGQEARAAAVLNGLLMDAPDDARARYVLGVLRERGAKAKVVSAQEDEENRTKTVEVSALALSDPELGNTMVEMPIVGAPVSPSWAPRAVTVQVPLGEWAELGSSASRGPEFPWDDEGPGKARARGEAGEAPAASANVPPAPDTQADSAPGLVPSGDGARSPPGTERGASDAPSVATVSAPEAKPEDAASPVERPLFEATQAFGKALVLAPEDLPTAAAGTSGVASEGETVAPSGGLASQGGAAGSASGNAPLRAPASVLVPGAPSKGFDAEEKTSEVIPPRESDAKAAVLVPGAPAASFDEDESTSEIIPPGGGDADQGTPSREGAPRAQASQRPASVLVPSAAKPAFDAEEKTSEAVAPRAGDDASERVAAKAPGEDAASARTPEEGEERARSQRQEAQLIARQSWRELAQLYLKRADRAKDAPERAEALTRLAEVMENELQDSAGAARMYREIVELTGERTALREQVRLLSQREDASLVRRALDDAIARARTSRARAVALLTRGERQLNMGAPDKARVDFESAEALVPGMLPVLAGLVRCASDDERFTEVERLRAACAAAPRRAPDRLEALRVLAQVAEESLGDLRIAQWAWAEVLAESPDNDQPREHLLALARRLGDLPALSQLLHAQLAREPRGPAARKAHLERVATLEAMGDAGAALAELRQAVRFEPGHKEAWLLLADRCTEREQFGEAAWALENAATATEDDEERQHTWERLALFCREVLHNTEKARVYARRAESLRKSREQRARPQPPEPPRPAPPPATGVAPPLLVAKPVATGLVPPNRKDLSDEVTSNTDVESLVAAEEAPPEEAKERKGKKARASSESEGAANTRKGKKGTTEARESKAVSGADAPKAPSGSHAPVANASNNVGPAHQPKSPSGRHAPAGAEATRQPKAPSGSHAPVGAAAASAEATRQPKAPSGSAPPLADSVPAPSGTSRAAKSADSAPAPGGTSRAAKSSLADSAPAPSGTSRAAKSADSASSSGTSRAVKSSLADSAPAPSGTSRAAKSSRGPAQDADTRAPSSARDLASDDSASPRASASPRDRSTAFGALLSPDADLESPPLLVDAPPTPSAVSRKASASKSTPDDKAAARPATSKAPADDAHSTPNDSGTQVREALSKSRVERAPRAGHAPRVPLSASGVEPPPAVARAPLSASGVEPPAPGPRSVGSPPRGRGAPEVPPSIPLLSQIPSEDEDDDAQALGGGPVEATSVIAWEAPPGRMDPVRRLHRAGRPEGTVSGPAPSRPPSGGRTTVGAAETRETPAIPESTAAAQAPAESTSAEPAVFHLVRERPLDPKPYHGLVEHFDQRGDLTRSLLMRELADALDGREAAAPRVQRGPLSNQERAGLRHPGLRTPAGELLACVGIALCRLFPSPARIANTTEPLRASSGPGATAILDALNTTARLLGVPLPELIAGDDDTANITPLHITSPRLVVGRLLVQQPPGNAELRFHAGRALFSLSPDLLALRTLRKDHLLRALALLSSVLKNPKDAGDDARVVRESLSPRALERAALLMEPGTRDFDASLLVSAARDSANRAGLVASGGPGPALTVLRARRPHESELEELVRFAASERYLALRDPAEPTRGGR
jgi:tetratricopeptide (TPR) repeat protein